MSAGEREESDQTRDWRAELAQFWESLPRKGMFGVALVLWLALFQFLGSSTYGYLKSDSLFAWMHFVYTTSADDGHCMFIPLVVLGLMWWKRRELIEVGKRSWWPGAFLVAAACLLHIGGYMVQQNRISIVGLFVGIYGLMGMVWGPAWLRAIFFPYFLFAFCVPLGTMTDSLTFPLRLLVSWLSTGISHVVLGIQVVRDGTQIFDPLRAFEYDVAAACSGIRSLTVLLALTTIYGFVTFRSTWKRLLMMSVALPIAVLGNVVRLTGVIATAEAFGQEAGLRFHDAAGFVTFALAVVCVMVLGVWLREDPQPERSVEAI